MKRRFFVVIALVLTNLALLATQAWADFPWPNPVGTIEEVMP
jgi:hypothetical protein